jgi:hypothetical protein
MGRSSTPSPPSYRKQILKTAFIDSLDQLGNEELIKSSLSNLSDQIFLDALSAHRGRGRNDYPIELLWKGVMASLACKVSSVEEMRRKMKEWPEIFSKVPSSFAFSRFFSFLSRFSSEIEALHFRKMDQLPPDFGSVLAIAKFGRIHFLWEPQFGLPLLFQMHQIEDSPAKIAEQLIERFRSLNAKLASRCKYLLGNISYEGLIRLAWERFKIRAVIPIRDSEKKGLQPYRDAYYDEQGMVYCYMDGQHRAMIYAGFEKSRNALKYRCMARHYGIHCEKLASCPLRSGIRIPISLNERIFTPLPRTSYRWGQIFSLYETLDSMVNMLRSYQRIANNEEKKLLCCRVVALLLANQKCLK